MYCHFTNSLSFDFLNVKSLSFKFGDDRFFSKWQVLEIYNSTNLKNTCLVLCRTAPFDEHNMKQCIEFAYILDFAFKLLFIALLNPFLKWYLTIWWILTVRWLNLHPFWWLISILISFKKLDFQKYIYLYQMTIPVSSFCSHLMIFRIFDEIYFEKLH